MNWKKILFDSFIGWFLIFFVILTIINIIYHFGTQFTKTVTVKKSYNLYHKSGGLMFEDTNNQTYKVKNVWFKGEFDAMEDWNLLQPGQKADVKGFGYRIPMIGLYPVVYSVKIVK